MRRSIPWLHLLLSFALIFNGISAAHASARMLSHHPSTDAKEAPAQAHESASQSPPCHEHATVVATDTGTKQAIVAESDSDKHHPSDCCKSGACRCECVQQSQIAIAIGLFPAQVIVQAVSVGSLKPAHAEVLLPHLIRPPIV